MALSVGEQLLYVAMGGAALFLATLVFVTSEESYRASHPRR